MDDTPREQMQEERGKMIDSVHRCVDRGVFFFCDGALTRSPTRAPVPTVGDDDQHNSAHSDSNEDDIISEPLADPTLKCALERAAHIILEHDACGRHAPTTLCRAPLSLSPQECGPRHQHSPL